MAALNSVDQFFLGLGRVSGSGGDQTATDDVGITDDPHFWKYVTGRQTYTYNILKSPSTP